MEHDVPQEQRRQHMPAPDCRPIHQLWDVHWSIVLQHLQCQQQRQQCNGGGGGGGGSSSSSTRLSGGQ